MIVDTKQLRHFVRHGTFAARMIINGQLRNVTIYIACSKPECFYMVPEPNRITHWFPLTGTIEMAPEMFLVPTGTPKGLPY